MLMQIISLKWNGLGIDDNTVKSIFDKFDMLFFLSSIYDQRMLNKNPGVLIISQLSQRSFVYYFPQHCVITTLAEIFSVYVS